MIVWRGWGILVVVLSFVPLLVVQLLADAVFGNGYYTAHGWPKFVSLALAAAFVLVFSRVLDSRPGRVVVDHKTGERLTLGGGNHLFFVPVRYWPALLLLAGVGFGLFGPTSPAADASRPPAPQLSSDSATSTAVTAVPQQVRTSLAAASGSMAGRWSGSPGADGIREVLVVDSQDGESFAGRSFFEYADGTALGAGGTVSGSAADDRITFTVARDDREFVWIGTKANAGHALVGRFEGLSNDAIYRRP